MNNEWPYPGARWWKFDFHTHTPASKDTKAWQRAMGTLDELTAEKWLLQYMAAEIDCVAITDHNSGAWIDKLKDANAQMQQMAASGTPPAGYRELHLFPGVEISVQGGFHLLTIFDTTATSRTISDLLAVVRYDGSEGDSDGVTREGAAKVVEEILSAGGVPIPAHADQAKGLLEVEPGTGRSRRESNTLKQVLDVPGLLAMEWCDLVAVPPSLFEEAKLPWARVFGSDCHSFQGDAVPGSRYTWVKMAQPSLEGLRLALLDGQDISIKRSDDARSFSPFKKPEHFIESIEIGNAQWMGRGAHPAHLAFNPYFNALVGGRGTGKSTVIHALRLAYKRKQELESDSEAGLTFSRFNKVAKGRGDQGGLRADTRIALTLNRDGLRHRLLWQKDGSEFAVEDWDDVANDFKPSASQSVSGQRFPVRLFSQGQIAALAGDSQQSLLKVIDEAAGTVSAQAAFDEAKREFFATRAKLRELDGKLKGREATNLGLQDIQRKLARFEAAHHAEVLKAFQRTSRQSREMDRQLDNVAELVKRLHEEAEQLLSEDLPDGLYDPQDDVEVMGILGSLAQAVAQTRTRVEEAAQVLAEKSSALKAELAVGVWQGKVDQAKDAYEALKIDLQAQGVNDPSEYGRLVQEKQRLETEAKRLGTLQKQFDELKLHAKAQLEQVWQARRGFSDVRATFLQETLAENYFVRIRLVPYGRDAKTTERSLRDVLGVPDKYNDDIYVEAEGDGLDSGLIADLMRAVKLIEKPDEPDTFQFEKDLKQLQKLLVKACQGAGNFGGWFNKFLSGESSKRPEFIDHILCWFPEDGLQVEYSRKGDGRDFQSIGQASAGQRAAAMLAFLLAHGDEPLVLDQPEDDLDNHLIYDLVVQQIRANKQRRQLIIVTHNPNIVVNGDAEMIYVFDFNHQCHVKENQSGSLQDQAVRSEVCKVMEGGNVAFERRYQRLGRKI